MRQNQIIVPSKGGVLLAVLLVILVLIAAAGGYYFYKNFYNNVPLTQDPSQACSMEAKQCPDGSYVGRGGPNCEFTPCPNIEATTTSQIPADLSRDEVLRDWKIYRNYKYGFEFKYPTPFFLSEQNINSIFFANLDLFDRTKDVEGHGAIMSFFSVRVQNHPAPLPCSMPDKKLFAEILFERCVTLDEFFRANIVTLSVTKNNTDFVFEFFESNEQKALAILSTFKFIK